MGKIVTIKNSTAMTEQQVLWHLKNKIHAASLQGANYAIETEDIDLINSALSSLPAPTQDGTAEEIADPMSYYDNIGDAGNHAKFLLYDDALKAMTTYAAPLREEIERLKDLIRSYDNGKEHYSKRCESLLAELTASQQRIKEMEEEVSCLKDQMLEKGIIPLPPQIYKPK